MATTLTGMPAPGAQATVPGAQVGVGWVRANVSWSGIEPDVKGT